jgi:ferrous iron transport protein B
MAARALAILRDLFAGRRGCGCDTCPFRPGEVARTVLLFGAPNVGKSLIFNHLTGSYAVVSNYPGTTVEITRGHGRVGELALHVVDTPGAYSLLPLSEDERVARSLLLDEAPHLVLHVTDAKNLSRMLSLTLQLIEAGLPVALDLNLIDEAERAGVSVDAGALHRRLGIPVVITAAATGFGMDRLRALLAGPIAAAPRPRPSSPPVVYPEPLASAARQIAALLKVDYHFSAQAVALLLLAQDQEMRARVASRDPQAIPEIDDLARQTQARYPQPLSVVISLARQRAAEVIAREAVSAKPRPLRRSRAEVLGDLAMHPLAGLPILLAVLYFGLYLLVGKLAAGLLVDLLDRRLFVSHLNPALDQAFTRLLPWPTLSMLFVGQYGLLTLGLRYALAIVLPLVGAFFLIFAVLEDSGYLPRLALLVDRLFKRIGLSGRAVIPILLGLGCDTMATLVTRILPTRRERIIATFLLALAIPCSAQLGVILGLLAAHPLGLAIWAGVVLAVFLASGLLAARLLPGETGRFYLEIPPLRLPSLRNVAAKTLSRLRWYAAEVIPLFLFASVLLWVGELTHLFQLALAALRPLVHAIGLPSSAADAFLFGFFRRDYGAARIFDIHAAGAISGVPLVVAMVTITLFVPCIAQFLVMQRERGLRTALAVSAIIVLIAFGVGYFLNLALTGLQVTV